MQGYHLSHDHFPYFTQVIQQKRGVFVPDLLVVLIDLLHFIPKPLVEQAARLNGITHQTPGVFLPLVVEGQAIGTLAVLGEDLRESRPCRTIGLRQPGRRRDAECPTIRAGAYCARATASPFPPPGRGSRNRTPVHRARTAR